MSGAGQTPDQPMPGAGEFARDTGSQCHRAHDNSQIAARSAPNHVGRNRLRFLAGAVFQSVIVLHYYRM